VKVPVPNIDSPAVDKDGKVTVVWHAFFVALAKALDDHEARIVDLEP
jgi:hypothetical protein